MERYKEYERESKTKAYSKKALQNPNQSGGNMGGGGGEYGSDYEGYDGYGSATNMDNTTDLEENKHSNGGGNESLGNSDGESACDDLSWFEKYLADDLTSLITKT